MYQAMGMGVFVDAAILVILDDADNCHRVFTIVRCR